MGSEYWSNLFKSFHRPEEDICSWFCLGTWGFFPRVCRNPISAPQIDSLRERWNNKQGQTEEAPGNGLYQVDPLQTSYESITMKMNARLLVRWILMQNISELISYLKHDSVTVKPLTWAQWAELVKSLKTVSSEAHERFPTSLHFFPGDHH